MDGIHSGEAKDSDTYAEDGSRKDNIDMEDSSGRAQFQYGGGGKEGGSNRWAVVERMVQVIYSTGNKRNE